MGKRNKNKNNASPKMLQVTKDAYGVDNEKLDVAYNANGVQ